jgi:hypothetical protein
MRIRDEEALRETTVMMPTTQSDQLVPLIDGIKDTLGRTPKEASADGGYCSEANPIV